MSQHAIIIILDAEEARATLYETRSGTLETETEDLYDEAGDVVASTVADLTLWTQYPTEHPLDYLKAVSLVSRLRPKSPEEAIEDDMAIGAKLAEQNAHPDQSER